MSDDLKTVIKVCDQVERNRRAQPPMVDDLARRAHTVFHNQGLDVSVTECQEAAEQVVRASVTKAPNAMTASPKDDKSSISPRSVAPENDLFASENLTAVFSPVLAMGAVWGLCHFMALQSFSASDTAVLNAALNHTGASIQSIMAWAEKLTCLGFTLTVGRALFLLFKGDSR